MSQQINLYDPALLKKRELLTAINVAAAALLLLVVVGAWGGMARARMAALDAESQVLAPQLKAMQDQMVALAKQVSEAKPNPLLENELAAARATLDLRGQVVAALKKGLGADSPSFAEYMRGFARQAQSGLWVTGFVIGDAGNTIEIRGRMTDAALLPDYIRRLNGEKAFQGRAFAALKVSAGQLAPVPGAPAPAPATTPAAPANMPAPFLEFVLTPVVGPLGAAGDAFVKTAAAPSSDIVPTDAGRALADAGRAALEGKR
jgi:hypothetical protein